MEPTQSTVTPQKLCAVASWPSHQNITTSLIAIYCVLTTRLGFKILNEFKCHCSIHGLTFMRDKNKSWHVGQLWSSHSLSTDGRAVCHFKASCCPEMQILLSEKGPKLYQDGNVLITQKYTSHSMMGPNKDWYLRVQLGISNFDPWLCSQTGFL